MTITTSEVSAENMANEVALALPKKVDIIGPESPYQKSLVILNNEVAPILQASSEIKEINSQEDAEKAVQFGRLLQVAKTEREGYFKKIKQTIDAIKSPVLEDEKKVTGQIQAEKDRLGVMQNTWDNKVKREKEEADRKAREEALKQAQEDQLNLAIDLELDGDIEQAEAVLNQETIVSNPTTQYQAPLHIRGKVTKVLYSATVTDLMELIKAVAAGKAPMQAIQANDSYINGRARTDKETFSLPGCKLNRNEKTHFTG